MDDAEADYVIEAVETLAEVAESFLPLYDFDLATGAWSHREEAPAPQAFSLGAALCAKPHGPTALDEDERRRRYRHYLEEARRLAEQMSPEVAGDHRLEGDLGELQYFRLARGAVASPGV